MRFPLLHSQVFLIHSQVFLLPTQSFQLLTHVFLLQRHTLFPDNENVSKENSKNFTVVAHFEIRERLAKGGMGSLYLAWDRSEKRMVVLKFLARALCADDAMVERFRREAKATAGLDHPNVVESLLSGLLPIKALFCHGIHQGKEPCGSW